MLRSEVTVDRRDRHTGLARHGRDGHAREAAGHDPDGRIEDARSRLVGLLRAELAAVGAPVPLAIRVIS